MEKRKRKRETIPTKETSAVGPTVGHLPCYLIIPKVKTRHRQRGRIASPLRQRIPIRVIRVGRVLEERALPILRYPVRAIRRVAVCVGEAHVELLVGRQVPAQHEGDDEGVVVLAVEQIREPDVLVARRVIAAAGARPGGKGLVRSLHEVLG